MIYQQINPGIKYEYMLPPGAANPMIPPRPPALGNGPQFGSNRWQDSGGSANPVRPTGLGAEGGLLQAIQDSNIQNSPPASAPSAPIASLSSSGSLANLGIAVPPIDMNPPAPVPSAGPLLPAGAPTPSSGGTSSSSLSQSAPSIANDDRRPPRNGKGVQNKNNSFIFEQIR